MAVTRNEVLKIAELAKLSFTEAELDDFVSQFQRILDYVAQLDEIDIEGVEPTSHVALTPDFDRHPCREDEVHPSLSVEDSLSGAPDPGKEHFRVPKVI